MRRFSLDCATLVRTDRAASHWVFTERNIWYLGRQSSPGSVRGAAGSVRSTGIRGIVL